MNKENRQGPFCKEGYKGWGFLIKMEEGEGLKGKIALHPLPLDAEQGMERWASAAALAGGPGHGGGRDQGKKTEESEGVRFSTLARARVERGASATGAGGGGRRWPWWRHCKARGGASGGGGVCGGGERDGRPIYRRSKAVGRAERVGAGRRAPRGAINGVWPIASVGGTIRGSDAMAREKGTWRGRLRSLASSCAACAARRAARRRHCSETAR